MQFYLQSSIVDKGVNVKQFKASRIDVIVGSIFTDVVAWFIIVACAATLYTHGIRNIADPADAAQAMKPLAGDYAFILFAAGLFNASLFAASILPLSTAYTVCEGLGFESGLDKGFREAKFFYWFYSLLLFAGAAVVLIPNFPLVKFSILSQVLNGILLPLVLVFMLKLINKHDLMGKYTNTHWFNIIAWATAIIVTALSLVLVWNTLHG
jgi:Mn2+/Fe2+ NRAMP family transporter